MTHLRILLLLAAVMLPIVAPAVVSKREEFQPSGADSSALNSGHHHHSHHHHHGASLHHQQPQQQQQQQQSSQTAAGVQHAAPVFNGSPFSQAAGQLTASASAASLSYSQPLMYHTGASGVNGQSTAGSSADYPEAAASSLQAATAAAMQQQNGLAQQAALQAAYQQQQNANQQNPNLYYYYYPASPEANGKQPKDAYQAQSSNQYSSQVQPQHQQVDDQSNQQNQQNGGHQDLNYGAQDLSYAASLNENSGQNGQGSMSGGPSGGQSNFDSQLASSLQQYGFGPSGGAQSAAGSQPFAAFSPAQLNQFSGMENGFAAGQLQSAFSNEAFLNQLGSQFGSAPSHPGNGPPHGNGGNQGSSGGPSGLSQLYQQAAQMYQGLLGGGSNSGSNNNGGMPSGGPFAAASQPHASYEPSAPSSYRSKYGLGTIIMPMLALAGLSLLIPTVSSLSTVSSRKKRSVAGSNEISTAGQISHYIDSLERYWSLYKTAVEREECMNRVLCELGDAVSNVRSKNAFLSIAEKMAPTWMSNKLSVFKSGALNSEQGKCKKYNCH